jgi:GNAT superfamily N-acetyltransferase
MAIATYADAGEGYAEVAIVVREDFQNLGVATHLVKRLEEIAVKNGYNGFCADVLPENKAMLHVFRKIYPKCVHREMRVVMDFSS